jgi:hypothetical protein
VHLPDSWPDSATARARGAPRWPAGSAGPSRCYDAVPPARPRSAGPQPQSPAQPGGRRPCPSRGPTPSHHRQRGPASGSGTAGRPVDTVRDRQIRTDTEAPLAARSIRNRVHPGSQHERLPPTHHDDARRNHRRLTARILRLPALWARSLNSRLTCRHAKVTCTVAAIRSLHRVTTGRVSRWRRQYRPVRARVLTSDRRAWERHVTPWLRRWISLRAARTARRMPVAALDRPLC